MVEIFAIFANFYQNRENKYQKNIISQIRENKSREILQIQAFVKINLAKLRKKIFCTRILTSLDLKKDFFRGKWFSYFFKNVILKNLYREFVPI